MFYNAPPSVFEKARYLRDNQTEAEQLLWNQINRKQLGVKFRRQHPIYIYIADFYCHEKKLVIEVDGSYHLNLEQKEQDELRSEDIREFGIEVIRFTNEQVFEKIGEVVNKLKEVIAEHIPNTF